MSMTRAYNEIAFTTHRPLAEAERMLLEQRAYVGRLIVCGGATQTDD